MATQTRAGIAARNAMVAALVALLDAGGGVGKLYVRTGAAPATPATADSGTLLSTHNLAATSFGAPASGVCIAAAIGSAVAAASGDAGHFRLKDFAGVCHLQGTAGEAGDAPNLIFDEKTVVSGGTVYIDSLTVTVPMDGS